MSRRKYKWLNFKSSKLHAISFFIQTDNYYKRLSWGHAMTIHLNFLRKLPIEGASNLQQTEKIEIIYSVYNVASVKFDIPCIPYINPENWNVAILLHQLYIFCIYRPYRVCVQKKLQRVKTECVLAICNTRVYGVFVLLYLYPPTRIHCNNNKNI